MFIVWDMEQTDNRQSKHFDFRLALIMRSSSLILSASQPCQTSHSSL